MELQVESWWRDLTLPSFMQRGPDLVRLYQQNPIEAIINTKLPLVTYSKSN